MCSPKKRIFFILFKKVDYLPIIVRIIRIDALSMSKIFIILTKFLGSKFFEYITISFISFKKMS